jgi:hypothetical protein
MNIVEKITALYPSLTQQDYPMPTQEQLDGVSL